MNAISCRVMRRSCSSRERGQKSAQFASMYFLVSQMNPHKSKYWMYFTTHRDYSDIWGREKIPPLMEWPPTLILNTYTTGQWPCAWYFRSICANRLKKWCSYSAFENFVRCISLGLKESLVGSLKLMLSDYGALLSGIDFYWISLAGVGCGADDIGVKWPDSLWPVGLCCRMLLGVEVPGFSLELLCDVYCG